MRLAFILFISIASAAILPADFENRQDIRNSDTSNRVFQWDADWNKDYTIHNSCNDTQYNQIYSGLEEAQALARHAKERTLRHGSSEIFQKYFGNASTAEVIGWFALVESGQNEDYVFRCDDPDNNCRLDGWAGHWRGENGTNENVICDLSYTSRKSLSQMCSQGYTVSGSKSTEYWASDLLHRIWHTPLAQEAIGHFADGYEECLELAETEPSEAVKNSESLRYYALEVYAYDVAVPGVGCPGEAPEATTSGTTSAATTSSASASTTSASANTSTTTSSITDASSTDSEEAGTECHTHANGDIHCI